MLIKKHVVCNFFIGKINSYTYKALFFYNYTIPSQAVEIAKFIVIAHDFVSAAY